ncbi:MAG: alpha-amylase family glycosyl hydrolase [Candidatus Odinarchaeota archaeon]
MSDKISKKGKWWQKGIIYQIYPRSYADSNSDGIGDLKGIMSKLNYLVWLGVDAIWLSPIYPSPMEDFGYDVSDYCDVDPLFGTLDDFDELLTKAHGFGIKVILDFVPNHSSDQHPWFIESRSSRDNPKRDWYIWKDPRDDGGPPNNWVCITGGSAWGWDEKTKQYFLHTFHPCQPDLNWRNLSVRKAMLDVLRFWLDREVDGFRIDMISWLSKDEQFRDELPNPHFNPETDYGFQVLDHTYSQDGPELFDFLKEICHVLNEYPDKVGIGEVDYYAKIETLIKYYGSGDLLDLPANFRLIILPWKAPALKNFLDSYDSKLSPQAWPNYQLGNHDQSRIASRIGGEQARLATMLLLTLRGTPFIYYGEEIGMTDGSIPPEKIQDPWEKTEPGKGRDLCRTPMQWNANPHAGFSDAVPWLPVASNYQELNIEVEKSKSRSMLHLYRRLIQLRRDNLSLTLGGYEPENSVPVDCFVYYRQYMNEQHLIALNFTIDPQIIKLPKLKDGRIVLSTFMDRNEELESDILELRGTEGCVIRLSFQ